MNSAGIETQRVVIDTMVHSHVYRFIEFHCPSYQKSTMCLAKTMDAFALTSSRANIQERLSICIIMERILYAWARNTCRYKWKL